MKQPIHWLAGLSLALGSPLALANQVDVLVFYTGEAAATSSGQDIQARIVSYVEHANQAYRNSDVDVQLRLVGTEPVQGSYGSVDGNVLGRFRSDSNVARLRQQYGADLVALISTPQRSGAGYICGVGYQPGGNENTGRFYTNASAYGYSMTGVSCGYNTFAHELGHNISLGHSHAQNSFGSVFPWGRGHGVSGLFSTVMAYPQSYGTRNHLAQFASPDQVRCEGQPCGSDINRSDGADAVTAINRLAAQVADFMPTAVIDDGDPEEEEPDTGNPGDGNPGDPDDGDNNGGDNGDDNGNDPELPVCDKPKLAENNLVRAPDFNELSPWGSFNNAASLTTASINTSCGRDNLLLVTDRTEYYGGPVQLIEDGLEAGAQYRVSAKLALAGTDIRDVVRISLEIADSQGTHFQDLPELSVTANEFSQYDETFTVAAEGGVRQARLLIAGPAEGVDFVADEVRLEKLADAPDDDGGDDNNGGNTTLLEEGFEQGGNGWSGYMGSWVFRTRTASEGNFGLASLFRMSTNAGPVLEATGLLEAGKTYQASFDVMLSNRRQATDAVELWAWYIDDEGAHWQKLGGGQVATNSWSTINSQFSLQSSGNINQLRLHVMGAATSSRIIIDNVKLGL
ncbi:peptidyl-Asp metalloendopeptidase Metallo peptidase. MEROPS family M72 [Marinobacter segnicrescens]|uniref:Peptidyl-Asp metalloendopeptidase Metallo peptidase. MEROPS family M72 n=1 Tax=Marinobacter segnicrescens TaxID=430453 RepID=A0A1I0ETY1_9GAMM|nr:carbohydrate binding domain-containing protein [Marinobacter segnicrescens]SET48057.1 peptidyl-Asp metalloendopeptidase Metallo peptidase. MEROPS family M72 [Marinobacter segnicrescens]